MSKEAMKLALAALDGIYRYGLDTLSGRSDGLDDRDWQRAGVNEMTKRARFGITALKALAEQPAQQEPVDFASLLREAEELVREKPTWKRFIEGTPLSNDIAVWMTVFAQDVARRTSPPAQRTWVGLTPEQAVDLYKATETDNRMVLIDAVEAKLRSKNEDRN